MKYTLEYTLNYYNFTESYHHDIEADNDKDALKQAKEYMHSWRNVDSAELVIIEKTSDGIICDNIAHYVRGCVWQYDER